MIEKTPEAGGAAVAQEHPQQPKVEQEEQRREGAPGARTTLEVVAGGGVAQAIGGIAAVVLAIVGLAGALPVYMAGIAALALGAALCLEGTRILSRYASLMTSLRRSEATEHVELGGGVSTELLAGAAGIVLGILALLGVFPEVLLPVGLIVFGGALLFGSGASYRLNTFRVARQRLDEWSATVASEVVSAATGTQVLMGLGAVILGILALLTAPWEALVLAGFLATGASLLFSGGVLTGRIMALFPAR